MVSVFQLTTLQVHWVIISPFFLSLESKPAVHYTMSWNLAASNKLEKMRFIFRRKPFLYLLIENL